MWIPAPARSRSTPSVSPLSEPIRPGGGFVPVAAGTPYRKNPDVAYNLSRNEYVVAYDVGDTDVKATRLAGGGTVLGGGEFGVAGWPDAETAPAIVSCSNHDQYFVVWQSQTASDAMEVYGRYLAGDGTTGVVVDFASTSFDEAAPDVACLEQLEEYVVVWEQQYYHSAGPVRHRGPAGHVGELARSRALPPDRGSQRLGYVLPAGAGLWFRSVPDQLESPPAGIELGGHPRPAGDSTDLRRRIRIWKPRGLVGTGCLENKRFRAPCQL
jgi:hypothetical protein